MTQADVDRKFRKHLFQVVRASKEDIGSSEQYGKNRDLFFYKLHPLPWAKKWEHEAMAEIADANGNVFAVVNTSGYGAYGHAGQIAGLLLAALKEVNDTFHRDELVE